jgi:hypothetical protein
VLCFTVAYNIELESNSRSCHCLPFSFCPLSSNIKLQSLSWVCRSAFINSLHRVAYLRYGPKSRSLLTFLSSLRLALFLRLAGNKSSSRPERSVLKSSGVANLLQRSVETFEFGLFCGRLLLQSIDTRLETGDSFDLRGSKIEVRVLL